MSIWAEHADRITRVLGYALNKTDRWGRYVPEPDDDWRAIFQYLSDIWDQAPGMPPQRGPLGPAAPEGMLELRPGARRMRPRGFGPLDQEPRRVPMPYDRPEYRRLLPYDPAFPLDSMTLEYRPRRDDNRFFMWPANAPRRNQG